MGIIEVLLGNTQPDPLSIKITIVLLSIGIIYLAQLMYVIEEIRRPTGYFKSKKHFWKSFSPLEMYIATFYFFVAIFRLLRLRFKIRMRKIKLNYSKLPE